MHFIPFTNIFSPYLFWQRKMSVVLVCQFVSSAPQYKKPEVHDLDLLVVYPSSINEHNLVDLFQLQAQQFTSASFLQASQHLPAVLV